ncbi:3-carboxy-cis,cis-muconate cycloisomerase [Agromyces flavus]|uniref:3-carboxy-cis,cis-muconate cycloisomerase n=1 Tax=Agromyces flavus TaxID=589382 RepID=A0A1H1NXD9_9MICO|nr:lyase family protein [Agromyces flavus]MCP2368028.1 3-carboxy-cis,cis-muconate cycloisomerase [Agromyces flavus]GGI47490.1 3-carboxy-cis,cis-muconate cycloisomerase [Agromyces flavus]SDS03460.1 3-carboxy-cis,cis-muconate cycloisomerase [Agromyces flavus]
MTDWGLVDPGAADASGTDDDAVLAAMVEVERALLLGWASELDEFLEAQADALDPGALDRHALLAGVQHDGVPVVALVPLLRAQLEAAGLASERLHLGATSQDVVDTALMLVARDALVASRASLVEAGRRLAMLAHAARQSPRIARSLARHGEASTLGVLAAGWLDGVSSAITTIHATAFPVQFGGAVGTGAAADAAAGRPGAADDVRSALAARLGLADPGRAWHTERTPVIAVASSAATAVAALGRMAGDATFLSREEIGEVRLASAGGSSAMPHKRNPVDAVAITAAAVEAPVLLEVIASAAVAGDERSAGRWHAEWAALRRLVRLARSASGAAARLLDGLDFDADRAAAILDAAGSAGARPDVEVLAAASDRIVDRAIARFTRLTDSEVTR